MIVNSQYCQIKSIVNCNSSVSECANMNVSANNNLNISENSNITAWIIIYIAFCIVVLCADFLHWFYLRDHNFRTNQKYLIGALCCTEIVLLIQFVMKGAGSINALEKSVALDSYIHFGDTVGGLMYEINLLWNILYTATP